jgi:putative oxidoreductase
VDTTVTLDLALLLIRVGVGFGLAAHGAQKLFGWFGGGGIDGTGAAFDSLGFRPGALVAGLAEAFGGLLLAAGAFTPLTGAVVVATMLTAASSDEARYVTGVTLPVDAGLLTK